MKKIDSENTWFDKFKKILVFEEGKVPTPYDDANGKPIHAPIGKTTIGVGRNLEANPLDEQEIELLLMNDISRALDDAFDVFGHSFAKLTAIRQMAIVAMIFQLGENGFRKFKNTISFINRERWFDAAKEMLDSKWAEEDSPARAARVSYMMEHNDYPLKYKNLF